MCVYVGGVVDVVECGLFFECVCGWIVSLFVCVVGVLGVILSVHPPHQKIHINNT